MLADPLCIYTGEGLSSSQFNSIAAISKDSADHDSQTSLAIFGTEFGAGPLCAIVRPSAVSSSGVDTTLMSFFSKRQSEEAGRDGETFKILREAEGTIETFTYRVNSKDGHIKGKDAGFRVTQVAITSGGAVSAVAEVLNRTEEIMEKERAPATEILSFDSLTDFREFLLDPENVDPHFTWPEPLWPVQDNWKQLIANSVTFTALSTEGLVYTWATDRRYSQCLGRGSEPLEPGRPEVPCQLDFLSHTKVVKVASGGYMTAALSDDGELFLWGQACPGIKGELRILINREIEDVEDRSEDDDEQHYYVKCVEILMQGQPARVVDVAVGSGHVLVAAELETESGVERAVFAAGQCEYGQLGIGEKKAFVKDFVEVTALRGKKVVSLAAAGWSSWVVVEQT